MHARPPHPADLPREAGITDELVAVDLGGTKLACARFRRGELEAVTTVPTERSSSEALLDQLVERVEATRGPATAAVGIGVPSVVEYATGRVRSSVNVPLKDVPLREVLSGRLGGLPVFVDNDATSAALAEAHDGDVLVVRDLVLLTIGTGVGGGIVIDGRPYRGATGAAGEAGHIVIDLDAPVGERFPQAGSLEALGSGTALDALARARGLGDDGRAVVEAAQAGDQDCRAVLRTLGERIGVGIANLINLFDPEEVVIGGGASAAGDYLLGPARAAARRLVLPGVGERTRIRLARYGNEAGLRGAALVAAQGLAEERELAPPEPEEAPAP